jgi:hypothetical protein
MSEKLSFGFLQTAQYSDQSNKLYLFNINALLLKNNNEGPDLGFHF